MHSAFKCGMANSRCKRQDIFPKVVKTMSLSKYDPAADLNIYAAHTHTAAPAVRRRGDHEVREELNSKAQDHSMTVSEKSPETPKQIHVPMNS